LIEIEHDEKPNRKFIGTLEEEIPWQSREQDQ